ncbi:hypothetical protein Leucomu_02815 [Leucobacter muris]|uniref:Uncharacterized protein n=1 Tax=Leucobacter muris TaxID=1935379 RepID=A0ABX5QD42_9MICO|nr:hypothetical protein [Leucobacter muris]QAB16988.1 hypothetical protein Leucomu_02815 [Leucobacter muris]
MTEIKWQEPEPTRTGRSSAGAGRWQQVAKELRKRPGQWALVGEDVAASTAAHLKKMGLEATLRGMNNGRAAKLYARFPAA